MAWDMVIAAIGLLVVLLIFWYLDETAPGNRDDE